MNAERNQHVLLVEDDETFAEEFGGFLASFGYEVRHVETLAGITDLVAAETFDVILLDQIVLGQDSIAVIKPIRQLFDGPVIIIMAMRADFYAHCANYIQLREALARNQEYIGAMSEEELRRAVTAWWPAMPSWAVGEGVKRKSRSPRLAVNSHNARTATT